MNHSVSRVDKLLNNSIQFIFICLLFDFAASLRKVKKGTLLIDSSTIDPAVSKEMAVAAEKMGAVFMDAPVSGGMMTSLRNNHLLPSTYYSLTCFTRTHCLDQLEVLTLNIQLQGSLTTELYSFYGFFIVVYLLNVSQFVS